MKKLNSLLATFALFIGLSHVFSSFAMAQDAGGKKEVKVKIVQKINGDTKTIEKTFSINDQEALERLLKEYDLNLNADELLKERQVEISIRKTDDDWNDDVLLKINDDDDDKETTAPRAFLGVYVEDMDDADILSAKPVSGAVVTGVIEETPAEKAGLKKADIIIRVNDTDITGSQQFRETIRSFKPGEAITITYLRDGQENKVSVMLEEKKKPHPFPLFDDDIEWMGKLPPMHLHLPAEFKDRPFLGVVPDESEDENGVRIGEVIEKSTAQEIGLKKGDVIAAINGKPVKNFDELREVIGSMKPGDEVKVNFVREGQAAEATGILKSRAAREYSYYKWDGKMPHCERWHDFNPMRDDEEEMSKEELTRKLEQLEQEIQKLKEQLKELAHPEGKQNNPEEKTNETKLTITIEDVPKNNLAVNNLFFSPNPNSGKFHLSFELPEKGKTTVKIFDVSNKEIYTEPLGKFSGKYDKQIDISENARGIYFLQIVQDNKVLNKKIIIQ
ncbi:MAG TPA: PDZ domain-containing protein [Chitinophagales bacterium]|nr:PDZ domain-containing protein [Chitinophagales bacterium]